MLQLPTMAAIGTITLTSNLCCRMTVKPRAVLPNSHNKMRVPYELKQGQSRHFHMLPSGLNMEFIFQKGHEKNVENFQCPPLVFVHGSFHAAWCWAEHWMPFFSRHGFDCYALSLLAQGESDSPAGVVAGSLQTHAADVANFIHKEIQYPPVLLGHSFGGLIVQYYIANVGNEKLQAMDDHLVLRYQKLVTESSRMPIFDLRKLNSSLPVPPMKDPSIKVLVMGANDDFIVNAEGLRETGRFYGVSPVCIEGIAHDMMLDCSWEKGAQVILSWLHSLDGEYAQ